MPDRGVFCGVHCAHQGAGPAHTGRRPEEPSRPEKALPLDEQGVEKLIAAFGGRENIRTVDNCFTRLRVTVNDPAFVKEQALKALPCSGVVQSGCDVQIVYGIRARRCGRRWSGG